MGSTMHKTICQLVLVGLISLACSFTCAVLLPFDWAGTAGGQILVNITVLVVSSSLLCLMILPREAKWATAISLLLFVLALGGYWQRNDTPPSLQHALLALNS